MTAFDDFARSQDLLIQKKYEAIYSKRAEILMVRKMMKMVDEPESDPTVQKLSDLLSDLKVLEHDLSLLQSEEYSILEKYLQLDELKLVTVFPRWKQDDMRTHLKSMSSFSSLTSLDDESSQQSSTSLPTTSVDYASLPNYKYSHKSHLKKAIQQELKIPNTSFSSRSDVPSPLPDNEFELVDQIRDLRAKLLRLKQKKNLSERENGLKLLLESNLKEAEAKHNRMRKR